MPANRGEWALQGSNLRPPACRSDNASVEPHNHGNNGDAGTVASSPRISGFIRGKRSSVAGFVGATACLMLLFPSCARSAPMPKSPTTADVKRLVPDYSRMLNIARCEQPTRGGKHGVRWNTPEGWRFQGGYGFADTTWDWKRPRYYPHDAGLATWQQQTLVADAVRDAVGLRAWGCAGAY